MQKIPGFSESDGQFRRKPSAFRNFISADPSSAFPAEPNRYALYIHLGCPWAHRTNIVRSLKCLEDIIQLIVLDDAEIKDGKMMWCFAGEKKDPLYGFKYLKDLYEKSEPGYDGRYLVPTLWDKKTETIVSNESSEIIRMFYTEFDAFLPEHLRESSKGEKGIFPPHLRAEIEAMNEWVYDTINNGVYKTGFATSQAAYEEHVYPIFASLDRLEEHLSDPKHQPFLFGDHITEADIRLYPTIARFDVAYFTIFKCNLKMIRYEYPRIDKWLRRLYWDETNGDAFKKTTDFAAYKAGYSRAVKAAVVPAGPVPDILPLDA
ncbi:glutathione transferase [Trematosphaeria pertusa]|uniref:Glutathione transferase n=1 Tax=Trematosphaeria pertusa TaxID=390896 RepID=A0A6A6IKE7_9PLEO|nr:glutathione transferase [Trematosphaeria pertusa]KAF2249963.1 glutathione transferase [Trematosphaeria pertusa]